MTILTWIILSGLILGLISLLGALVVLATKKLFNKIIPHLVSFSAGALLGGAFFYLIPESIELLGNETRTFLYLALGLLSFYILEQFIHWHHCHKQTEEHNHPVSYLILAADAVHNFVDGLAVGAAFLAGVPVGIATLIAVVAHEIPQELGDFGILIHSGWKIKRALLFNFVSSLTFLVGALLIYTVSRGINVNYLVPFAAGGFIYIASTDLIPEINRQQKPIDRFAYFITFVLGLALLLVTRIFLAE